MGRVSSSLHGDDEVKPTKQKTQGSEWQESARQGEIQSSFYNFTARTPGKRVSMPFIIPRTWAAPESLVLEKKKKRERPFSILTLTLKYLGVRVAHHRLPLWNLTCMEASRNSDPKTGITELRQKPFPLTLASFPAS